MEMLSEALGQAKREIDETTAEMRRRNYLSLVLQARAVMTVYRPVISKFAASIKAEFRDQYGCSVNGGTPAWQLNQKKVEARAERNKSRAADKSSRSAEVNEVKEREREAIRLDKESRRTGITSAAKASAKASRKSSATK